MLSRCICSIRLFSASSQAIGLSQGFVYLSMCQSIIDTSVCQVFLDNSFLVSCSAGVVSLVGRRGTSGRVVVRRVSGPELVVQPFLGLSRPRPFLALLATKKPPRSLRGVFLVSEHLQR